MVRDIDNSPHIHIRWTGKEDLDWECFATHDEARERGIDLMLPGESFMIEEIYAKCPLREKIMTRRVAQPEAKHADSSE